MEAKVTLGGGCFWCTEALFRELKGVMDVKSGYSGGHIKNPAYREVCSGRTGHAEVIEVTYNPEIISFEELILIHLTTHNPTTPNQQGADKGTQYRSIIFYRDEDEKAIIENTIRKVQTAFDSLIVTEVKPFDVFYEAEPAHQNYYAHNTDAGYCEVVINPKLKKFRELYADKLA